MKWTKCSDLLPGNEKEVLAYSEKSGFMNVDIYDIDFKHWESDANISHWMFLPEPPK